MILHRALASAGDDDDLRAACGDCFFYPILDQRALSTSVSISLGVAFVAGQKARAHTSSGKYSLSNLLSHAIVQFSIFVLGCYLRQALLAPFAN